MSNTTGHSLPHANGSSGVTRSSVGHKVKHHQSQPATPQTGQVGSRGRERVTGSNTISHSLPHHKRVKWGDEVECWSRGQTPPVTACHTANGSSGVTRSSVGHKVKHHQSQPATPQTGQVESRGRVLVTRSNTTSHSLPHHKWVKWGDEVECWS